MVKLTDEQSVELLRKNWHPFCDCDPMELGELEYDDFTNELEAFGLIHFRIATRKDVDVDSFAADRGIEVGGGIWELTDAGRAAIGGEK